MKSTIFLLILVFNFSYSQIDIKQQLSSLLIDSKYKINIIFESPVIKQIKIVAIDPPYREFPNVFIFQVDSNTNETKLIVEALSFGIQDKKTKVLDLHTIGMGVDFVVGADSIMKFRSKFGDSAIKNAEYIAYNKFIHFHTSESTKTHYSIDKTDFFRIANKLFDNIYIAYPQKTCIMYDQPMIKKINFLHENGKYLIHTITENNQSWSLSFDGIIKNKYIINKKFEVKNL